MTAPEWAVEKAARTLWIGEQESDKDRAAAARYWDDASIPDDVIERDYYRRQARAALDAVWPDTTTEWRVTRKAGAHAGQEVVFTDEWEARAYLNALGLSGVDRRAGLDVREVGAAEWREVQP